MSLLEHVAHPRRTDADEHFDEVTSREAEKRHARFAGDGFGQQRLTGSRRADQQHAAWDFSAQLLIFLSVLQKVDHFFDFFDGFIDAGHVVEADAKFFVGVKFRAAASKLHRAAGAAQPFHHVVKESKCCQQQKDQETIAVPKTGASRIFPVNVRLCQLRTQLFIGSFGVILVNGERFECFGVGGLPFTLLKHQTFAHDFGRADLKVVGVFED